MQNLLSGGNKVNSLTEKSNKITDVFTKTVKDLGSVNSEIDKEQDSLKKKIDELTENHIKLQEVKEKNQKFVDKINQFLND